MSMTLKEIKYLIQSTNVNILYGSGLSVPYLSTLGPIEKWLTQLAEDKAKSPLAVELKIAEASIYKLYFGKVLSPNYYITDRNIRQKTIDTYSECLSTWNDILNKRRSSLLHKQVNLFTTNVDTLVETAAEISGIELNDGFRGTIKQIFDESNFQKTINKTSLHFQNTTEIPVFNLMKLHGSVNWHCEGSKIVNDIFSQIYHVREELNKIDNSKFVELFTVDPVTKAIKYKSYDEIIIEAKALAAGIDASIYDTFLERYRDFIMVNPTKRKFVESVMDYHFYELIRMYSNSLEKENSLLFVMGFSFADEHIARVTMRAVNANPTLQVIIFAYDDVQKESFENNLGITGSLINNNVQILTPSSFKETNQQDYDELCKDIETFDFITINKVFGFINNTLHSDYEY